ncbi:hypothetical protein NW755_013101 [Fusarium falciforme]|uniref:NmrA-like domain-containing protein n=1 Tax=Fusarium falciforme TaxID=195108 RepID=A0A9W8UU68_9HYPO|nr:hypothetical protein NW755_013101 [Fusarium falciforme]
MVTQVKNVALVGASGNLGVVIQDHFLAQLDSPLRVSVLTRQGSDAKLPAGLNAISTDYSPASLEQGLRRKDVVIMFLPPESTVDHETVMDAAVRAVVKRFFPPEYGRSIVKYLEQTQDVTSWTAVLCNPWIDFALYTLLTDPERFEEAKNMYIHVASYTVTQNEILSVVEELTGQNWKVENLKSNEVVSEALESIKNGWNWGLALQVQAILTPEEDLRGLLAGEWKGILHWQPEKLPNYTLKQDIALGTRL